jgi:lipoprotein-releasing system permease protein
MNWPFLVARHLAAKQQKSFSKNIVLLAVISVALSSAIMIIALATVSGFQNGIKDKVIGVNGHIIIDDISNVEGSEPTPLRSEYEQYLNAIKSVPGVQSAAECAIRPCIARGEGEIDGMVAKGVPSGFDLSFFKNNLVQGHLPDFAKDSNTCLISDITAKRLGLKIGEHLQAIFFKQDSSGNQRARAITPMITGVFSTGLEDYDKVLILTHISQVRKTMPVGTNFTQWEVRVDDFDMAEDVAYAIQSKLPPGVFNVNTAKRYNRQIFDWLGILDTNVIIILSLMLLVACINMCTTLLILITERTQMVGTLKAMGARDSSIRSVFIYQSLFIALVGLFIGNVLGLGFCWLQDTYGFIRLNEETYYVNRVLVDLQPWHIPAVNIGTLVLCLALLFLPAIIISRMTPVRTIKFQ